MHINNQKFSFYIFTVLNIFMEHDLNILMIFGIKKKKYNFDPYNVILVFAAHIPQRLKSGFVVQGHIYRPVSRNLRQYITINTAVSVLRERKHENTLVYSIFRSACVRC